MEMQQVQNCLNLSRNQTLLEVLEIAPVQNPLLISNFISSTIFFCLTSQLALKLYWLKSGFLNGCTCQPGALAPLRPAHRRVIDRSEVGRTPLPTELRRRAGPDPLAGMTLSVQWTWKYSDMWAGPQTENIQ